MAISLGGYRTNSRRPYLLCIAALLLFCLGYSAYFLPLLHPRSLCAHGFRTYPQSSTQSSQEQAPSVKIIEQYLEQEPEATLEVEAPKEKESSLPKQRGQPFSFTNLDKESSNKRVLILTPLKDATPYLERYFELINRTTYPNQDISIAFLVSDSQDDTLEMLQTYARKMQEGPNPFHDIRIFQKDFNFELPPLERHRFEMQPFRRSIMARSRNMLLSSALTHDTDWVAWIDVDVIEYPSTIFQGLMSVDVDIVVPNCFLSKKEGQKESKPYDKNNWQETSKSLEIQKALDPEFVMAEGYKELETGRDLVSNTFCIIDFCCKRQLCSHR